MSSILGPGRVRTEVVDETGAAFGTADNPLVTQLNGSTVEDYNGGKAVRTKTVALSFETWRMANGSTTIEVTAGSSVQEPTEKLVNGFGTLTCIAREVGGQYLTDGKVYVSARWMPAPGATTRSAYEKMAEFQSGATAVGSLSTKAAYVRGTIWNADVMDVVLTVDFMLRA